MFKQINYYGKKGVSILCQCGSACILLYETIAYIPTKWNRDLKLLIYNIYKIGVLSLPIIVIAALFVGMVLGLQGYTILVDYGAEQKVGQLIALTLVRELAPVVGSLLFTGRSGSAITAEIALMKATEQLDCLTVMGINPLHRVVAPRFWAGVISLPLLIIIFNVIAIYGGYLVDVEWLHIYSGNFWNSMKYSVNFYEDVVNGLIKSVVFGFIVSWIAVYQGMKSTPNSEGIGSATTRTVIIGSLAILGLDFILTALMFGEIR